MNLDLKIGIFTYFVIGSIKFSFSWFYNSILKPHEGSQESLSEQGILKR
jgi:hypothetical protein